MSKYRKMKWLIFLLSQDGIKPGTLSDEMDSVELYCILVLFARTFTHITKLGVPLDVHLALQTVKTRYAKTKRGVEKKRLKYLKEQYDNFLFEWEINNPMVQDIY